MSTCQGGLFETLVKPSVARFLDAEIRENNGGGSGPTKIWKCFTLISRTHNKAFCDHHCFINQIPCTSNKRRKGITEYNTSSSLKVSARDPLIIISHSLGEHLWWWVDPDLQDGPWEPLPQAVKLEPEFCAQMTEAVERLSLEQLTVKQDDACEPAASTVRSLYPRFHWGYLNRSYWNQEER